MVILLACTADQPATVEPLAPPALLSRLSLDLRGIRPTEEELSAVEADAGAIDGLVDQFLADPAFGERLVSLYADVYLTRSDNYVVGADGDAAFLDDPTRLRFLRSVGEEPLRLIQRIADDDLPYTTVVTADWTVANDPLFDVMPLEPVEDGEGWRKARYTDDRPAAGILATNGLWWRYTTTIENANRGRAEVILRHLLCDDRFDQPVAFGSTGNPTESLGERAGSDPSCVACHSVLDPVASFLYGFYRVHPESYSEALWYYPGRETLWRTHTGIPPGYYGTPGDTLYDLGRSIAQDPRFPTCAVEQGFTFLMGREPEWEDTERVTEVREEFLAGGATLRALYRSLVADPRYRSIDEAQGVPLKRMGPDQLASAVEALTGFRWTWEGLDMLTTDYYGLRILAGGADGVIVTRPATGHATTTVLVEERLAELAAAYAVARDSGQAARTLFREVDPAAEGDTAGQVRALVHRVHGRTPDATDVDTLVALWDTVRADGDPARAWAAVLAGLLRHPDFVQY